MNKPICVVFGVGKNIGAHTVQTFLSRGYRVAQAARSLDTGTKDDLFSIACDLAKPVAVTTVFETVRQKWGEPEVVIYNAAAWTITKPEESLAISIDDFESSLTINTTSPFVAAREALASFRTIEADKTKTFLYTGGICNEGPFPGYLSLSLGKTATAHLIETADSLYQDQGIRFFYVDERQIDGRPMYTDLGGQVHADMFLSLVERTAGEVPWQITFVKDRGYTTFPHEVIW